MHSTYSRPQMVKSIRVRLTEALYYRTAKLVEIRNWKLGVFHRGIQVSYDLCVALSLSLSFCH